MNCECNGSKGKIITDNVRIINELDYHKELQRLKRQKCAPVDVQSK